MKKSLLILLNEIKEYIYEPLLIRAIQKFQCKIKVRVLFIEFYKHNVSITVILTVFYVRYVGTTVISSITGQI